MQLKNEGLILQTDTNNERYVLFDEQDGKIFAKINNPKKINYFSGLFISYSHETINDRLKLKNIEIEFAPTNTSASDINFLHLILELCNLFLPEGQENSDIYRLVKDIFVHKNIINIKYVKKIILCQFFFKLGIIPEKVIINSFFKTIMHIPIDRIKELEIDLNIDRLLNNWIIYGIKSHPNAQKLKTVRFFEL